jgi:hypothetical protein
MKIDYLRSCAYLSTLNFHMEQSVFIIVVCLLFIDVLCVSSFALVEDAAAMAHNDNKFAVTTAVSTVQAGNQSKRRARPQMMTVGRILHPSWNFQQPSRMTMQPKKA